MEIGNNGAGAFAQAFARKALKAGHKVKLSNSRGPDSLRDIVNQLGPGATAATEEEAAACEMVLLAVPWDNVPSTLASLPKWKSHPLEGSRQEAIPRPSTTFDIFSRGVPLGTLPPRLALSDASVFSLPWRRLRCAAPVTHQDQGLVTSRCCARRLSPASSMPQKTLGSLPCPSVYSVQIVWLPRGSTFSRAHGRGVATRSHAAAGHVVRVETGTTQIGWMLPNFSPSLPPQPNGWPDLSQRLSPPQRVRGLASCNSRPVTAYEPRLSVPRSYCYDSSPAYVGKNAGLLVESAWQTVPLPYTPMPNTD